MKRILLAATILTVLGGGSWVAAQTATAPKSAPKSAPATAAPKGGGPMMGAGDSGMMGNGMMGNGAMGNGMGGGMMGGGICPMMVGGQNTKVDVKKVDKGVSITLTSSDVPTAVRLQKMAEAMRLMHEAMAQ